MKMAQKNAWNKYKKDEIKELESLCKDYREFLDNGKTERECVKEIVKQAEDHLSLIHISEPTRPY